MKIVLGVLTIFFATTTYGQDAQFAIPVESILATTSFSKKEVPLKNDFSFQQASQTKIVSTHLAGGIPRIDYMPSLFCKLEYQLESKSKLAPRFRLGSLQYTNWMEGKADFYTRYYK